jgi:hypothetical protein
MKGSSKILVVLLVLGLLGAMAVPAFAGLTGAIYTTDSTCNGVNVNFFNDKEDVYLDGGPQGGGSGLPGDSTYYVQVTDPSGKTVLGTSVGSADETPVDVDSNGNFVACYQLWAILIKGSDGTPGYDDTPNGGGVYKVWVSPEPTFTNADTKTDNFKVGSALVEDLTVSKTATPAFTRTYAWTITKDVDKTLVEQIGGTATFNYTIRVTHDAGTDSAWAVTGKITVVNPNLDDVAGVDVTDAISGGDCAVTAGTGLTIPAGGDVSVDYVCTFSSNPGSGTNTATATWPDIGSPNTSATGTADFIFGAPTSQVDECVAVSDSYAGTLGTVCVGDANPTTFTYSRVIAVPAYDCLSYDNTATFTTNDTGATGTASQTVTVCGPAKTGALTMGFWQNKNGQDLIKNAGTTCVGCKLTPFLRQYAPFQDLSATATCTQVATYVYNIIKAANASGASMNAMLKAQMLATALDVYFSDPALGGNKIGAPAPIGGVAVDLTKVCKNIAGGCTIFENVSGAFGGATSLTVSQMLAYAASQSNAGGGVWYGQVKATQELAKDAFDAINNQKVFAP